MIIACIPFFFKYPFVNRKNPYPFGYGFVSFTLVVTLILVLASSLGLLAALNAGALVVLLLSQIGQNTGLSAGALKSLKSVVQRLVFLDVDFRHLFPSLQIRLTALQGPTSWLCNISIITAGGPNVNDYFAGLTIKFMILFLTTMVLTSCIPLS